MDGTPTALEDRFVDLEIRLSHQEAALEQLTRQLLDSQREIRRLLERIDVLEHQLRSFSGPDLATPEEETPPPHY